MRYARRIRVAWVLSALGAVALAAAVIADAGSGGAQPPRIERVTPDHARCAAASAQLSALRPVVVQQRAEATIPIEASATESAVASGVRGVVRASAKAVERTSLTAAATATEHLDVTVHVTRTARACSEAPTAEAEQRRAGALAEAQAQASARAALRGAVPHAGDPSIARARSSASRQAAALARRAALSRAAEAQAAVEARAAAAARRDATARAQAAASG